MCARGYAVVRLEAWLLQGTRVVSRARMRDGSEAPAWECKRRPEEDWDAFVVRCAAELQAALQRVPEQQLELPGAARVVYHVAWAIPRDRRAGARDTGAAESLESSAT